MAATLYVYRANLGARRPMAKVVCADCGAAIHFDVDSPRLRNLVTRLAEKHRCVPVVDRVAL